MPREDDEEQQQEETPVASPMSMQDGIRDVHQAFATAATPPRWPMYVRQAKQFLRNTIEGFDERKYGFASVVDLLRAAGKEGVLRLERDRQGAIRVFPGVQLAARPAAPSAPGADGDEVVLDETVDVGVPADQVVESTEAEPIEASATEVSEPRVVDGQTIDEGFLFEDENDPRENFGNREQPHPVLDAPLPGRRPPRKRKAPMARPATKQPRAAKSTRPPARPAGRRPPRRKPE